MSKSHSLKIAPSIFAADFGKLADEAKRAEESGADLIHVDIMDGHFVPNLSLSPRALAAINRATPIFLDVHIMVYNPFDYIERLVESGADRITFHLEASEHIEETIDYIHKSGIKAGLAISPDTSASLLLNYLDKLDLVLIMTVHPGFGGQAFIPEALEKVRFVREFCDKHNIGGEKGSFEIQVDGGVDDKTAPLCIEAGANNLVSGSYLYKPGNMAERIQTLRGT